MRALAATLVALLAASRLAAQPTVAAPPEPGPAAPDRYLLEAGGARLLEPGEASGADYAAWFRPGERLEYRVGYYGVPVGTAVIEVARWLAVDGRRVAHVVATARTNEFFSRLYPVRDRSEAWIDLDRGVTWRTATHTRHGRRKETTEEVRFDWDAHLVHVSEHKRHKRRLCETVLDFGPDVYDTFDVFYAIRGLPLDAGLEARLPVYASGKVYTLQVRVSEPRETHAPALGGAVRAWVLRPANVLDGEPQRDGKGVLLVSDDERRVPLSLNGWFRSNEGIRLGGVRVELVAYRPGREGPGPGADPRRARLRAGPSREGRPLWDPPAGVLQARAGSGGTPEDGRRRDCRELAAPAHTFASMP